MHDTEYSCNLVQIQQRYTYVVSAEIYSGQTAAPSRHTKPKVTTFALDDWCPFHPFLAHSIGNHMLALRQRIDLLIPRIMAFDPQIRMTPNSTRGK